MEPSHIPVMGGVSENQLAPANTPPSVSQSMNQDDLQKYQVLLHVFLQTLHKCLPLANSNLELCRKGKVIQLSIQSYTETASLYHQFEDKTRESVNAGFTQPSFPIGVRDPYSHRDVMGSSVRFILVPLNYLAMILY